MMGLNARGTARTNRRYRYFPQELVYKRKQHERSFFDYRSNGLFLAVMCMDKRYIYFVSTLHSAETGDVTIVRRRQLDGTLVDVECPPLLPDYQAFMRGVDRSDQYLGLYNVGRRSRKWWKRVL